MKPVAWMYDFLNSDNRDEVIRNWVTQDIADIEREKGFNVRPLYLDPLLAPQQLGQDVGGHRFKAAYVAAQREWVSLTDDDIALLRRQGAHSVSDKDFRAIDALLKEKNNG